MIHADHKKAPQIKKTELTEQELLMEMPFDKYIQQYGPLKRNKHLEKTNDKQQRIEQ